MPPQWLEKVITPTAAAKGGEGSNAPENRDTISVDRDRPPENSFYTKMGPIASPGYMPTTPTPATPPADETSRMLLKKEVNRGMGLHVNVLQPAPPPEGWRSDGELTESSPEREEVIWEKEPEVAVVEAETEPQKAEKEHPELRRLQEEYREQGKELTTAQKRQELIKKLEKEVREYRRVKEANKGYQLLKIPRLVDDLFYHRLQAERLEYSLPPPEIRSQREWFNDFPPTFQLPVNGTPQVKKVETAEKIPPRDARGPVAGEYSPIFLSTTDIEKYNKGLTETISDRDPQPIAEVGILHLEARPIVDRGTGPLCDSYGQVAVMPRDEEIPASGSRVIEMGLYLRVPQQTAVSCSPHFDLLYKQCSAHTLTLNTSDHRLMMCFKNSTNQRVVLPRGLRAVTINSWKPDPIMFVACTRHRLQQVKRNVVYRREEIEMAADSQTVFVPKRSCQEPANKNKRLACIKNLRLNLK